MTVAQLARDERADLVEFLTTLTPEQWNASTLCGLWTVREIVAHVISYDDIGISGGFTRLGKGRLSLDKANDIGVELARDTPPDELIAAMEQRLEPRGLPSAFGARIALLDCLIHHQDIRRPLGAPREVPERRLLPALDFARFAPPIRAFWRTRGLRLVATDLDWASGRGPVVEGPAEALLMAMAGRRGVVHELTGPGQATLATRIQG
ncbi:maleylpyruvate isomerase family mycothiol-dependent enzyme [Pseudonocardia spinosispora]|uniref:maleylpyruvate isomerase family mycothiol-dependent enzyme n=1 Tax=Pseudonocardia spinosispora TaxID=103441 RepID=UPI0004187CF1|nr:maleylpyruvate isomerase family mycothiol-dependent enzyme [Pseudonocardia spinosispora]